jgi:hypothetical protein
MGWAFSVGCAEPGRPCKSELDTRLRAILASFTAPAPPLSIEQARTHLPVQVRTLASVVNEHGSSLRNGWTSVVELLLALHRRGLLPDSFCRALHGALLTPTYRLPATPGATVSCAPVPLRDPPQPCHNPPCSPPQHQRATPHTTPHGTPTSRVHLRGRALTSARAGDGNGGLEVREGECGSLRTRRVAVARAAREAADRSVSLLKHISRCGAGMLAYSHHK